MALGPASRVNKRLKKGSFRVKFSLFIAEFPGDLCVQNCSLNGIAFIQIAPPLIIVSESTLCTNLAQYIICVNGQRTAVEDS